MAEGNPNNDCAKRIEGKRKLTLVLIQKCLGQDKGNSQFTLWPTYSYIKGVLSVPGKRTDACVNTCCLCFIFRLFHQRKESRASWTSGIRPHLVFSGFLHTKGPNKFPSRPGQEVQPALKVAAELEYMSLDFCPRWGLYHHPTWFFPSSLCFFSCRGNA